MIDLILEDLRQETPEVFQQIPEDILKSAISAYVDDFQKQRQLPKMRSRNTYTAALKRSVKRHIKLPRKPMPKRDRSVYVAPKKKKCTKCKQVFHIEAFTKQPNGRHKSACKTCIYSLYYRPSHLKRLRKSGKKPKAEMVMTDEQRKEKQRSWKRKYCKKPEVRLATNIRKRVNSALKKWNRGYKGKLKLIGCTKEELRDYLEKQFKLGMSWDNYGEWHVDHIQPLCSFNLLDDKELAKAAHYTNLRPLWAKDNLKKSVEDVKKKFSDR